MRANSSLRHSPQTGLDTDPSYYTFSYPAKMREQYVKEWHAEHDPQLGHEPTREDTLYKGHDWDDMRPHLNVFFQSVKSRKPVTEDAVFGNNAAIACHMANESYFRQKAGYMGCGFEDDQVLAMGGNMRSTLCAERNRKTIPVLLGFLVLTVVAFAQDLPSAKPESVGLSVGATGANHGRSAARYRRQAHCGCSHARGAARQGGLVQGAGHDGSRGREADADGCDVPHLLDDQADHDSWPR